MSSPPPADDVAADADADADEDADGDYAAAAADADGCTSIKSLCIIVPILTQSC